MRPLARRLQRLESTGTFIDIHLSVNRLVHEAALEVDLPAACHQQRQSDVDARLHALRQSVPASLTHERQVEAMVHQVCQAVRAGVDTVVAEPQRFGLYAALTEGCRREARRRGA
jgi:hypothetical protein